MQKWSNTIDNPLKVSFLLFDRFSNLCLANCLEPMRAVNDFSYKPGFDWYFSTPNGAPVNSSSNLPVMPHGPAQDIPTSDYVFVLASYDYQSYDTPDTRRMLRNLASKCNTLVGLDTAPWLLASAGLLNNRRATVHWDVLDDFSERFLQINPVRHRVVWDETRVTCAGAMSAFDLTRSLIQKHFGTSMALDVDALFLRDDPTAPTPRRYDAMRPSSVQKAIALMQANLEMPLSLGAISKSIACPPKTLARRFHSTMGASPGQVYRHLRLTHARQLVETTGLSVYEIALRCGYTSPTALTRAYKARFGHAPTSSPFS